MARRLDIGSGYSPFAADDPEWEHLEVNPNCPHVEHAADAFAPLPFADETFDELRAVDVLEHTSWRQTAEVLAEWCRILKRGGQLTVMVPDAETVMVLYAQRPAQLVVPHLADEPPIVSAAWRLMGGHEDGDYAKAGDDWRWNAHYALFSDSSLRHYLTTAGFIVDDVARNPHPNLIARATRV